MPRPDQKARSYEVHSEHALAAHGERIAAAKAARGQIMKQLHAADHASASATVTHGRAAAAKARRATD